MKLNVLVLSIYHWHCCSSPNRCSKRRRASTGADSQVSDLSISNGLYLGLDDWRFGVQVPVRAVFKKSRMIRTTMRSFVGSRATFNR